MLLRYWLHRRHVPLVVALVLVLAPRATFAQDSAVERRERDILVPLYAGFATLQALDVHSTLVGHGHGAQEANPLLQRVVDNPAMLVAVKASAAASTIFIVEKVRKRNRTAAIAVMVALNSLFTTVVAHNYQVAK